MSADYIPSFAGDCDPKGRIAFDDPQAVVRYCRAKHAGTRVDVTIRARKAQRSDRQNRYWWGVVIPLLAEHCGYTDDEMHEALKAKFLGTEDLSRGLLRIGSTKKLGTKAFADLVDRVTVWAAQDLGVMIPPPIEKVA